MHVSLFDICLTFIIYCNLYLYKVEAHDVTAPDPEFLIYLKGVSGTVPVPRHWGRKRKYLQGKRGVEKPPFALPDFIVKTGICDVRDATAEDESKQSAKQKNRLRVSGRGGGVDVDYRTLYEVCLYAPSSNFSIVYNITILKLHTYTSKPNNKTGILSTSNKT